MASSNMSGIVAELNNFKNNDFQPAFDLCRRLDLDTVLSAAAACVLTASSNAPA